MERGPIFVAGADRSGTTLMYALLTSHPNIAIPRLDTNMWTYFYKQYGDLSQPDNFERCLQAMLAYKNVLRLKPDPTRLREEFWQGEPTYARLFALIQDQYAERASKTRWGDKTSYIERYADPIFAAYPEAKMVHMIRDPRDRYASAITRWPNSKGGVGGATARWLYSVGLGRRNQRRYPDRYRVVCYETLVFQPEKILREICTFLGEEYYPLMLSMSGAENFSNRGGNSSFVQHQPGTISSASIGRFRKVLSRRDIAFIQMHARRGMLAYNYPVDFTQFSLRDWLAFYTTYWPVQWARMVMWRIRETVQQSFPAQFGDQPLPSQFVSANGDTEDEASSTELVEA